MILNNISTTETNCNIEGSIFKVAATPITFEILSSRLYANPKLAVVRELITNAYDSHKLAGKLDTPIKITFPDYINNNFIIRDFGTGLCKEDVMELYTTFFSSTKSNSNDFTGCFGLGSKTPFSYTSTFAVNSYYNGIKYFFTAVKKDGYPHIYCINEIPTEEPNGLEVIIPTNNDNDLFVETYNYLKYIPEILIDSNKPLNKTELLISFDDIFVYKSQYSYTSNNEQLFIKQGQNIYLNTVPIKNKTLKEILTKVVVVFEVPIGTFSITPSRESLSKDQNNIDKLTEYINIISNKFINLITTRDKILEDIDVNLYLKLVLNKYFDKNDSCIKVFSNKRNNFVDLNFSNCNTLLLDTNSTTKLKFFTLLKDKPVYIVIAPDSHLKKHRIKLKNIIINYDLKYIYVLTPNEFESFKSIYKIIKNTIFIFNEMTEMDFDIRLFNINQFLKSFPDYKRKTSYIKRNIDNKQRVISYYSVTLDVTNYAHKVYNSISYLHSTFNPNNTIILEGKECDLPLIQLISVFINKIRDKDDNNFIVDFLNNKKLDSWLDKSYKDLTVLIIPKTYLNQFKAYNIINRDELLTFVKTTEWTSYYVTETESSDLNYLTLLNNTLNINFKRKALKYIQNSKLYKLINKCITNKKLMKYHENQVLVYYEFRLLAFSFGIDKLKFKKVKLTNLLPYNLKKLRKLVSYNTDVTFNEFLNLKYYKLSNNTKIKILNYIKGENNAIFFK